MPWSRPLGPLWLQGIDFTPASTWGAPLPPGMLDAKASRSERLSRHAATQMRQKTYSNGKIALISGFAALMLASAAGCNVRGLGGAGENRGYFVDPVPEGDVAYDAADAWPQKGVDPDSLTPAELLRGCALLADCWSPPEGNELADLRLCVLAAVFSAERAIPWSGYAGLLAHRGHGYSNERAEIALRCALDGASDCAQVDRCLTNRSAEIYCEEDGCRPGTDYTVSCDGTVAHLEAKGETVVRDCALAAAICDESSPTGCTDRPFSACPAEPGKPDWCDRDVLLGCDTNAQVTYRDCSRVGGKCVDSASAGAASFCEYPGTLDLDCLELPELSGDPICEGEGLVACVLGTRVRVSAPEFCLDLVPAGG